MTLRKPKDFLAGLLFLLIAATAWYLCRNLNLGTARNMGPGYFPLALAALMALLGSVLMLRSFAGSPEPFGRVSHHTLRAILAVLGAGLVFGLLVRPLGLAPAVLLAVLIASLGMRDYGLRPALTVGAALAIGCSVVFVSILGLPIRVFGPVFAF